MALPTLKKIGSGNHQQDSAETVSPRMAKPVKTLNVGVTARYGSLKNQTYLIEAEADLFTGELRIWKVLRLIRREFSLPVGYINRMTILLLRHLHAHLVTVSRSSINDKHKQNGILIEKLVNDPVAIFSIIRVGVKINLVAGNDRFRDSYFYSDPNQQARPGGMVK